MSKPTLNITIPAPLKGALEAYCRRTGRKPTAIIGEQLRRMLEAKGINCDQPLAGVQAQLDALGYPPPEPDGPGPKPKKKRGRNPSAAQGRRAA